MATPSGKSDVSLIPSAATPAHQSFRSVLNDLSWDLERYAHRLHSPKLHIILLVAGFQATAVYRLGHWLLQFRHGESRSFLYKIVAALMVIVRRFTESITGIYISPEAEIGAGLLMLHFGGIVIGPAKIGRNCEIFHGVTLGMYKSQQEGLPTLGDRVYLAPGAKILGPITVGNDVSIGANTVLSTSVPDRWVMMGIPARRMTTKGSFEMVFYPGMESDADRCRSLEAMADARHTEDTNETVPARATIDPNNSLAARAVANATDTMPARAVVDLDDTMSARAVVDPNDTISARAVVDLDEMMSARAVVDLDETMSARAVVDPGDTLAARAVADPNDTMPARAVVDPDNTMTARNG